MGKYWTIMTAVISASVVTLFFVHILSLFGRLLIFSCYHSIPPCQSLYICFMDIAFGRAVLNNLDKTYH
jgi:hypothetical protein